MIQAKKRAGTLCRAALAAASLVLCLPMAWGRGQHGAQQHAAPVARPHYQAPHAQNVRPQQYGRAIPQAPRPSGQSTAGSWQQRAPQSGFKGGAGQAVQYRGQGYAPRPASPANGESGFRAPYNGSGASSYARPGHLGSWLNQHRELPLQQQEQLLRRDPSFNRLPQNTQQRLMQQLHNVEQMPQAQRDRRLARTENLERLTPQQRAQVQEAGRQWTQLPADRQTAMRNAFRDLRSVPPDQRSTVLNSGQYQRAFSPQERGILSKMLSVEPYQSPQK
jgi:hypothetical protein